MSDDESAEEELTIELSDAEPVEGAPIARIASRLTWPQEKSTIIEKEGDSTVRTTDGPQSLEAILSEVETTYFSDRQGFLEAVREVIGIGPMPQE